MQFCTTAESDTVQNNTADTKALPQRPEEERNCVPNCPF